MRQTSSCWVVKTAGERELVGLTSAGGGIRKAAMRPISEESRFSDSCTAIRESWNFTSAALIPPLAPAFAKAKRQMGSPVRALIARTELSPPAEYRTRLPFQ